ncbi:MAG: hypothetical protein AAGE52_12745 [Myxococcota bacterium]
MRILAALWFVAACSEANPPTREDPARNEPQAPVPRIETPQSDAITAVYSAYVRDGLVVRCITQQLREPRSLPQEEVQREHVLLDGYSWVSEPCEARFSDPVLATCRIRDSEIAYYRSSFVGNERVAAECAALGGEWAAVPSSSPAVEQARQQELRQEQ